MYHIPVAHPHHALTAMAGLLEKEQTVLYGGEHYQQAAQPAVVEIIDPAGLCPKHLCLGNPFATLLSGFAWMFPRGESCRYPASVSPSQTLPEEVSPASVAAQVISNGRLPLVLETSTMCLEMIGSPDQSGVLEMNLFFPTTGAFETLGSGAVRMGFFHQAVAAASGLILGRARYVISRPIAKKSHVEAVLEESRNHKDLLYQEGDLVWKAVSGSYDDWLRDASMFAEEHVHASGYSDRFVRRVLSPAMASWCALTEPDVSEEDRIAKAKGLVENIADVGWKQTLGRFLDMQAV